MSAQQMQPARPQHQQQQQPPWWAGPLNGIGSAFQGMQHNLQQFANNLPKPPGSHHMQQQQQPGTMGGSSSSQGNSQRHVNFLHTPAAAAAAASLAASSSSSSAVAGSSRSPMKHHNNTQQQQPVKPVTKEELGRATWVFLHTLAAQFPERPTRQQQKDARQLVDSLTRIYPCADCAKHFQEIVKRDPPDVSSGTTFSQWMCRVHNTVNRRLDKPTFNCDLVGARWAPLDCDENNSCDMTVGRPR